jgi:hypothetical protein
MDEELLLSEIPGDPEFKNINPTSIRCALNEKRIEGRLRGKYWAVTRAELRRWLATQRSPHKRGRKAKLDL